MCSLSIVSCSGFFVCTFYYFDLCSSNIRLFCRLCWSHFWPTSCPHLLCVDEWLQAVCRSSVSTHGAPSVSSPISSRSFWVWCLFVILGMVSVLCIPVLLVILGMVCVLCIPVLTDPPQFLHLSHHHHSGYGVCSVYTCTDRAPSVPSPVSSLLFWVWCLFVILGMVSVLCIPVLTEPPQFLHLSHHRHSGYGVCLSFWVWCLFFVCLYWQIPLSSFTYLITVILGIVSVCHSGYGVCSVYTCTDRAPSAPSPISSQSFWV